MRFPFSIALAGLLLAALACVGPVLAANPFTGAPEPGGGRAERVGAGGPFAAGAQDTGGQGAGPTLGPLASGGGLLAALAQAQRELRQNLSDRVRGLRDGASASGLAAFLALAFAYGALHAAGPGHGKAVAVSYVVARREGPGRAALLGGIMGAAHAASAVALVFGLYMVLERSLMARFTAQGIWLERASYALVCAIALWLLARALRGHEEEDRPRGAADRGLLATGLATGLVPCPGAAIVLLFALALGAPLIGLGAVAAMALGMGATIAAAAVVAALCRRRVAALAAPRSRRAAALDRALSILGALCVLALGAALLAGSLG
jgi:ABC-type nickel/cobalt efflux system permease component RcnA